MFDIMSETWMRDEIPGSKSPEAVDLQAIAIGSNFYTIGGYVFECNEAGQGDGQIYVEDVFRYQVPLPTQPPTKAPSGGLSTKVDVTLLAGAMALAQMMV